MKNKRYFPLYVDLSDKNVVVVGGGTIATRRVKALLLFTRNITVIAPKMTADLWELGKLGKIQIQPRPVKKSDFSMAYMVLAVTNNRELNEEIGVNVSKKELNFIKEKIDSSDMCNVFRDVYVIKKDIKINEFKFNDGEVIDAKYINIEMLDDMIRKGESFEWLTYFIDLYKEIK